MKKQIYLYLTVSCLLTALVFLCTTEVNAQNNSVVQIHADKGSGYGVAYGGPQNLPDRIVTALHVVAGKSTILVVWQGRQSYANIEKIYKEADLAVLKLQTPLGIPPMALYSGNPPWNTNVQFWEIPVNTRSLTAKSTVLEESTSLAKISPRVSNTQGGLTKALCQDAGQYYPGMSTEVINFKEPNIRKAHSGSPLTYNGKIVGLVDGGANLVGGKSCVWAIPAESILRLYNQGTAYPGSMASCGGTTGNKYMYSGMRSDNPLLSQEEAYQASSFESTNISNPAGLELEIYHDYRMSFEELYMSMFHEDQEYIDDIFASEDDYTLTNLYNSNVDIYTEASTGVTLMVPSNTNLTANRNEFGTYLTTSSPGGTISIHFYITSGGYMEGGMEKLRIFKNAFEGYGYDLNPDADDIDDFRDDEYNPYYSEYVSRQVFDEYGNETGDYTAELMVNDGDFLAIIIQVNDWEGYESNPDEIHYLYLMESCALFSDFGYY